MILLIYFISLLFLLIDGEEPSHLSEEGLTLSSVLAVGVFLWAFVHQFRSALILAGLRKNDKGIA